MSKNFRPAVAILGTLVLMLGIVSLSAQAQTAGPTQQATPSASGTAGMTMTGTPGMGMTPVLATTTPGNPFGNATITNTTTFTQTGFTVRGPFLRYWLANGGLRQQGYPVSPELYEVSKLNGQRYLVQYFERAVFEFHPEFAGTENEVLLAQLGTFELRRNYPGQFNQPNPNATPGMSMTGTPGMMTTGTPGMMTTGTPGMMTTGTPGMMTTGTPGMSMTGTSTSGTPAVTRTP